MKKSDNLLTAEVLQALYNQHYKKINEMAHVIWQDTPILSFDTEVRGFLWADIVQYVEHLEGKERKSALKKVINVDKKLYDFFLMKFKDTIFQHLIDKSISSIVPNSDKKLRKEIESERSFHEYVEQLVSLSIIFDKIVNIFTMCDFYLGVKTSKLNDKEFLIKKNSFDVNYISCKLMLKLMNHFLNVVSKVIDTSYGFIGNRLLSGMVFMLIFKINPFMLTLSRPMMGIYGPPLLGKLLKWTGVYDKIQRMVQAKDCNLYINHMIEPLKETNRLLRDFYELALGDFEEALNDGKSVEECGGKLAERMKMFGRGYNCIEKVVDEHLADKFETEELEGGWIKLSEPDHLIELSMTQNESYYKQY